MPAAETEARSVERVLVVERPAGEAITIEGVRRALIRHWWLWALVAAASVALGVREGSRQVASGTTVVRLAMLPDGSGQTAPVRGGAELERLAREVFLPAALAPSLGRVAAERAAKAAEIEFDSAIFTLRVTDLPLPAGDLAAAMTTVEQQLLQDEADALQRRTVHLEIRASRQAELAEEAQRRIEAWRELDLTTASSSFDQTIGRIEEVRDQRLAQASEARAIAAAGVPPRVVVEAATLVQAGPRGLVQAIGIGLIGALIFGPAAALAFAALRGDVGTDPSTASIRR